MKFLEAKQILKNFSGGPGLRIHLGASGDVNSLLLYVRASAAEHGRSAEITTLPFGTLGQALFDKREPEENEVILLLPWDFAPECDWRSGIPLEPSPPDSVLKGARDVAARLRRRHCRLLYLPAPIPPLYGDPVASRSLWAGLSGLAAELGARFLDSQCFGLGNYLASGFPISGHFSGEVAKAVVESSLAPAEGPFKVLVTDLDNVLWSGLISEDGLDGIRCDAEGIGFRHFLFQGLLKQLKANGVVLAAVSRNDLQVARSPILEGRTLLSESDFVEILASYGPKSQHIRDLAKRLSLGLESFVFVDDNSIELAEVCASLPQVRCLEFPPDDDQFVRFLWELSHLFGSLGLSKEDRQRTEMYRRYLQTRELSSDAESSGKLEDFLLKLRMKLTIFDRSSGQYERALQLINKTNQFNLNGNRLSETELLEILESGGRLYTAKLEDRTGGHGEILACLINREHRVVSFVLSCRVFQRHVEKVFVSWLVNQLGSEIKFAYMPTPRNTPFREFVEGAAFFEENEWKVLDGGRFVSQCASHSNLFELKVFGFE